MLCAALMRCVMQCVVCNYYHINITYHVIITRFRTDTPGPPPSAAPVGEPSHGILSGAKKLFFEKNLQKNLHKAKFLYMVTHYERCDKIPNY